MLQSDQHVDVRVTAEENTGLAVVRVTLFHVGRNEEDIVKQRAVVIGIIGIISFVLWFKQAQKSEIASSATTLSDSIQLVSRIEGYQKHRLYIDSLVQRAHVQAFDLAYRRGSPESHLNPAKPASFDKDRYLQFLFMTMRQEIREDIPDVPVPTGEEYRDIGRSLGALRKELGVKSLSGV